MPVSVCVCMIHLIFFVCVLRVLNTFAFCKYSEAPIEMDVLQAV